METKFKKNQWLNERIEQVNAKDENSSAEQNVLFEQCQSYCSRVIEISQHY